MSHLLDMYGVYVIKLMSKTNLKWQRKILIFQINEIRHIYIEQKMKSEKVYSGIRTRTIQWTSSDTEIL